MLARPGTGRSGKRYPYYACRKAEETKGKDCKQYLLPAKAVDDALLEFLNNLRFQPETVKEVIAEVHKATSCEVQSLKVDQMRLEQNKKKLGKQISNLVDILADQGKKASKAIKFKLMKLEEEYSATTAEIMVIKESIQAQQSNYTTVEEQIQTLTFFNDLVAIHKGNPARVKELIPVIVRYVVWKEADDKGQGKFELRLFNKPFANGKVGETLKKLVRELEEKSVDQSGLGSQASVKWGG